MAAAVCPGGSIEVKARVEIWSMETVTRQMTFVNRVFIGANIAVAVIVMLVDAGISKP